MKIQTGYLYYISDDYFKQFKDKNLMLNHEEDHFRPSYLAIKHDELLWFIPLSSKVQKYKKIINQKIKKYGTCQTILIRTIIGREAAVLIQNAFPTLEKYVKSAYTINGARIKVSSAVKRDIINSFENILTLKKRGLNLFFTDIDYLKDAMLKEKQKDLINS